MPPRPFGISDLPICPSGGACDALVVGPPSAEGKLRVVRALPRGRLDFNYYRDDELHAVNGLLRPHPGDARFPRFLWRW